MTTFVGKGQDIARAIDNALLFCDPKAEYLPGVIHVEFSMGGVAFSACDDYATGRDRVGEVTLSTADARFTLTEGQADEMAKAARSARTKAVTLTDVAGQLVLTVGEDESRTDLQAPGGAWDDILPLIDVDTGDFMEVPRTVAFNAARFAKFGRVKGAKDAPVDIKFHPAVGAPLALVKVGPTFRGELQGVRRDEALKHMGPEGPDCFW